MGFVRSLHPTDIPFSRLMRNQYTGISYSPNLRGQLVRKQAVSEVVGAFVLVAIAVLAMTILLVVLYANPLPTKVPSFSGLVSNQSNTIYISHEGGDPLYWGQYKILVDNVDETWNFTKSLPDPNRTFSLGRVMNATLPKMSSRVVLIFNTSWGGGTVLLSADLVKNRVQVPYGWYDGDWLHRKKITIDHTKVPSDQSGFPVLISITDVDISASARHDGNDILFTDSTGMTKLPMRSSPIPGIPAPPWPG